MSFEVIIGLEIHAQINTKTKLFCDCDNDSFGKDPNVNTCPICMGFPGVLPVPNKVAVEKAIQASLMLGCRIADDCKFDRKNYFYPDLPKGFQISQFDAPLALEGMVEIEMLDGVTREIGITRLHIEDDAGKLVHSGNSTLCDYNRSGTPLMEIVTEPDLRSPEEAEVFARMIQIILQHVDASDADMEKGMMRFDASISLREEGSTELNPRAEIKNLNSFKALKDALTYEVSRQMTIYESGKKLEKNITVGWRENLGETKLLREKESASDYRYFPEPDIPPLKFSADEIDAVRETLPPLPSVTKQRYMQEHGLSTALAAQIAYSAVLNQLFEKTMSAGFDAQLVANMLTSVLVGIVNDKGMTLKHDTLSTAHFMELMHMITNNTISKTVAKEVLKEMLNTGRSPKEIVQEKGLEQISDDGAISEICKEAIKNNEKAVQDYLNGKERALSAMVGYVMAKTKGKANPAKVTEELKKLIN